MHPSKKIRQGISPPIAYQIGDTRVDIPEKRAEEPGAQPRPEMQRADILYTYKRQSSIQIT
jgi:hypothetical protein